MSDWIDRLRVQVLVDEDDPDFVLVPLSRWPLLCDLAKTAESLIKRIAADGPTERREAAIVSALAALRNEVEK